jgi:hypothetical protein
MRFRKRDGIWKVRLTIDGPRFERSTGCADRKAAELAARDIELFTRSSALDHLLEYERRQGHLNYKKEIKFTRSATDMQIK